MRLCVLTTSYPRYAGDPAGTFVAGMTRALSDAGARVRVVAAGPGASDILPMTVSADSEEEEREAPQKRFAKRLASGPSLKDELAEMVREDPDAAASILRTWIGNAS